MAPPTETTLDPRVVPDGTGDAYWWFGELATVKVASEDSDGRFSLVEVVAPASLEVPRHVHQNEDETFVIVEGSAEFTVGDDTIAAQKGDVLFGPRNVPHSYRVGSEQTTFLYLFTPGGFEGFVRDAGVVAPLLEVPNYPGVGVPDPARLAELADAYGVTLLG